MLLGVSLGGACLIRPVYLIIPAFFFLYDLFFGGRKFWPSLRKTLLLAVPMLLVMVPNVIRNYNVAHRFILVSEQGGVELYHNSVISFWQHPEYAEYGNIWEQYGWPLMKKGLGLQGEYSPSIWYSDTAAVADVYWKGCVDNLTRQPLVYLTNIFYNVKQIAEYKLDYWGGKYFKQNLKHQAGMTSLNNYLDLLRVAGSAAFLIILLKKNKGAPEKTLLFFTLALILSYSLVFYYPRYNYIKLPVFFLSLGLVLGSAWDFPHLKHLLKPLTVLFLLGLLVVSLSPLYYFYIYL